MRFLSKPMWTAKGLVDLYFPVFPHLGTRRYSISPCTAHPTSTWVSQQAKNLRSSYVMRDNDVKFAERFDAAIESSGAKVKRTAPLSPNLRAGVEHFIQSLKFEVLDRFVIVAEGHLNHICRVWSRHYNSARPHSARDHLPPDTSSPPAEWSIVRVNDVVCTSQLGGVIDSYSRRAA